MSLPLVVEPADLARVDPSTYALLDATWIYRDPTRSARAEFAARHLPGARFWSLDDVSEPDARGFVLMLPSPARFAAYASERGIGPDTHVVVYDTQGAFAAPRTVFTFLAYGHQHVSMLNGGLHAAIAEGFRAVSGEPEPARPAPYPAPTLRDGFIVPFDRVAELAAKQSEAEIVIDARGREVWNDGHIPLSCNVPWQELVVAASSDRGYIVLPSREQVHARLRQALGEHRAKQVAEGRLKVVNTRDGIHSELYDESWSGYSRRPEAVIEKAT
ncbi:hypothetical protein Q5752_004553 [Cryptotrichosporon argae]